MERRYDVFLSYNSRDGAVVEAAALRLGFAYVESRPLVRSSYHAHAAVLKTEVNG